jgi:hypothetical protein
MIGSGTASTAARTMPPNSDAGSTTFNRRRYSHDDGDDDEVASDGGLGGRAAAALADADAGHRMAAEMERVSMHACTRALILSVHC